MMLEKEMCHVLFFTRIILDRKSQNIFIGVNKALAENFPSSRPIFATRSRDVNGRIRSRQWSNCILIHYNFSDTDTDIDQILNRYGSDFRPIQIQT